MYIYMSTHMRDMTRLLREHGDVEEHPYTLIRGAAAAADLVTDRPCNGCNGSDHVAESLEDVAGGRVGDLAWDAGEPVMLYVFRHSDVTAL